MDSKQWAMFLHLSQLLNFIVPLAGIVAPIVIWQVKKNDMPEIDGHGKAAVNWIISAIIYSIVSGLLVFAFVGIFLLLILAALSVIFPIIAGIKASSGELWKYPLAIEFLK